MCLNKFHASKSFCPIHIQWLVGQTAERQKKAGSALLLRAKMMEVFEFVFCVLW